MKKAIIFLICVWNGLASAQITVEAVYDTAATLAYTIAQNQIFIVNLENSGYKYIKIARVVDKMYIYNLDHSLNKVIQLFDPDTFHDYDVLYISETLFNTDNNIEFMVSGLSNNNSYKTYIYDESSQIIFAGDSLRPAVRLNIPQSQVPIYNTPNGTKLILSHDNGKALIYSIPVTLSNQISESNWQLIQAQSGQGQLINLYPNPSNSSATLQYQLPNGEQQGEIILYNTQGAEVKRYKVDNTFKDIIIDNTQLPAGTYFYQLQTSKGAVGVKKMVVVK